MVPCPKVLCTLSYTRWQHFITSILSPLVHLYSATAKEVSCTSCIFGICMHVYATYFPCLMVHIHSLPDCFKTKRSVTSKSMMGSHEWNVLEWDEHSGCCRLSVSLMWSYSTCVKTNSAFFSYLSKHKLSYKFVNSLLAPNSSRRLRFHCLGWLNRGMESVGRSFRHCV